MASRLLSLLAAYRVTDSALTLAELSRRTGLPPATAHRLIQELLAWGALEREGVRSYRIGTRLFEVGMLARAQQSLWHVSLPYIQELYEYSQENVHLAILSEAGTGSDRVVYIEKVAGRRSVPAAPRSGGGSLPIHATASGKVLLAYAGPDVMERVIQRGMRRFTPYTLRNPAALRDAVNEVRTRGYALGVEEVRLGVVAVAAPVCDTKGVVAALSVVGRSSRLNIRQVVGKVRHNALAISRLLGGHDPVLSAKTS